MKSRKFFKWIGIISISFIVLLITGMIWITREGRLMYGGLTERVDHEQFNPGEGVFAISNVSILSDDGKHMIPGQTVLLKEGVIAAIDSSLTLSQETTIIDGSGKYLIPGLIDTHVHLFQSPNDLLLYLANGVTEIRELIGEESHLQWRDEIARGRIGPKMFVASPRLGSFDSWEGLFMSWSQGYMNIQNAEEAREQVKQLYEDGYDGIKIYSQINKESYLAVTETAKSFGMPVFGHIPWELELSDVWENGQSSIAHFEELMNALGREFNDSRNIGSFYGQEEAFLKFVSERSASLASNLIENDIAITSTLWLTESFVRQRYELAEILREVELEYTNPGISEWVSYIPQGLGWLPEVNRYKILEDLNSEELVNDRKYWDTYGKACKLLATNLSAMGVKIMTGTDTNLPPAVPGFSLHDEMSSLNNAGMTAAEVLRSATAVPAQWLKSNSGKILPGYDANLVLLDKNPLQNIANTKTINTVISGGRVFNRTLLDDILKAIKRANDNSRKANIDEYIQ
ncbi:MAG: amidohydrolase family protein [Eudoraea sp.]|nr:amidohydrolase family protein [Eudoraea sp.]